MDTKLTGDWKWFQKAVNVFNGLFRPTKILEEAAPKIKSIIYDTAVNTIPNASITSEWKGHAVPYISTPGAGGLLERLVIEIEGRNLFIGWRGNDAYIMDILEYGAAVPVTEKMRKWFMAQTPPVYLNSNTTHIFIPGREAGRKANARVEKEVPEVVGDQINDVVRSAFHK